MTCFLTPDGRPFFCGTYYPKESFLQLLAAVVETWQQRRDEVEEASDQISAELRSMAAGLPGGGPALEPALCDEAVAEHSRDEDPERGGFGRAPKFPPSALLEALLRQLRADRRRRDARGGRADLRGDGPRGNVRPARGRLRALQRRRVMGGAALREDAVRQRIAAAGVCALGAADGKSAGAQDRRRDGPTSSSTRSATGGMFTSSLDADTDGVEGLTYVWTPEQLRDVLGGDDGRWAADDFRGDGRWNVRARQLGVAVARRPRRRGTFRTSAGRAAQPPAQRGRSLVATTR